MSRATCRYCYEYGHNKMGCPTAKQKANDPAKGDGTLSPMQQYDKYVKEETVNTEVYYARRHFGWSYPVSEAVEIQLKKRARSRKVKKCNYCDLPGHNRRTCKALKFHKALAIKANKEYRKAVKAKMDEIGLGIGTVLSGSVREYDYNKSEYFSKSAIGLVTGINMSMFNLFNESLRGTPVHDSSRITVKWNMGSTVNINPPKCFADKVDGLFSCEYWDDSDITFIAPGKFEPSDEWYETADIASHIDKVFKSKDVSVRAYNNSEPLKKWSGQDPEYIEKS